MKKSVMIKKCIAMLCIVLSASLPIVAMEEFGQDPFAWNPLAEDQQYKKEVQQAIDEKNSMSNPSEEEEKECADDTPEKKKAPTCETAFDQLVINGSEQMACNDDEREIIAVARRKRDVLDAHANATVSGDPLLVGWANAMGDDAHRLRNAPYQENALPDALKELISDYQKEWRVIKNIPCNGSCDGSDARKTVISRGSYKGQDSIFLPFKRYEKAILSARGPKSVQWYLGIINSNTHALQTKELNCSWYNQWPVVVFPLQTKSASPGLIIMANDGQVQWHNDDIYEFPRIARSVVMLSEHSIAIGSVDGHVEIWTLNAQDNFEITHDWQGEATEQILSVAAIPSSCDRDQSLVFCSNVPEPGSVVPTASITLWNYVTGENRQLRSCGVGPQTWTHVIAMPDGRAVVAIDNLWTIEAWDVATGTSLGRVTLTQGIPDQRMRMAPISDNRMCIAPISNDEVALCTAEPDVRNPSGPRSCMRILNIRTREFIDALSDTAGAREWDAIIGLPDGKVLVRRDTASTMVCGYKDYYSDALSEAMRSADLLQISRNDPSQKRGILDRMKSYMQLRSPKKIKKKESTQSPTDRPCSIQ